jgi:hypothetical protein
MALSRISENRLNKARRFGGHGTTVKLIKPITPMKSSKRRISIDARKESGTGKPVIIIDARRSPQRVIKNINQPSHFKSLGELVEQYEKDQEKPIADYTIVPTPKRIFHNTIVFNFKCEKKQWTSINPNIDKFDMTNGGKLMGEPVIECEEEEAYCVCHARCRCSNPQWVTTSHVDQRIVRSARARRSLKTN